MLLNLIVQYNLVMNTYGVLGTLRSFKFVRLGVLHKLREVLIVVWISFFFSDFSLTKACKLETLGFMAETVL